MLNSIFAKKSVLKWIITIIAAASVVTAFTLNNAPLVRTGVVEKGKIVEVVELQGKVELENSEKIYSRLQGFVDNINASEGDEVSKGYKLAALSVEDLDFAMNRAEADYKASMAQLETLRKSIKPEHIKLAEAEMEKATALGKAALSDYLNKQDNYEKIKKLYDNGALSEKDLKDSETQLAQSEGNSKQAEQVIRITQYNLDIIKDGVSKDEIRTAEADVEAKRVVLDEIINNKGKTNISSSTVGVVLTKEVEDNQAVSPGDLLFEIGNYDTAYIRVDVLADDIVKINKGQKTVIYGDVLKDAKIVGEVYYIAPKATSKVSSLGVEQQRVEVRIRFDNRKLRLKPGYTLDVDISSKEKAGILYISGKSVFEMDEKDSVFVIRNNKLELRAIETGIENDDFIEVISGLDIGERIVVDPDSKLVPGRRINYEK